MGMKIVSNFCTRCNSSRTYLVCNLFSLKKEHVSEDLFIGVVKRLNDASAVIDSGSSEYEFRKEFKRIADGQVGNVYKLFDHLNPF